MITRRRFGVLAGHAVAAVAVGSACRLDAFWQVPGDGRSKPGPSPASRPPRPDACPWHSANPRDGFLQMPAVVPPIPCRCSSSFMARAAQASASSRVLVRFQVTAGVAVLAIDSRYQRGMACSAPSPGRQVHRPALEKVFALVAVDPARLTIGGFSDGASLRFVAGAHQRRSVPRVAAFSNRCHRAREPHGKPRVFMSQRTSDDILPIDQCGGRCGGPAPARLRCHVSGIRRKARGAGGGGA
jgi:phospholipase/carboxylesterase